MGIARYDVVQNEISAISGNLVKILNQNSGRSVGVINTGTFTPTLTGVTSGDMLCVLVTETINTGGITATDTISISSNHGETFVIYPGSIAIGDVGSGARAGLGGMWAAYVKATFTGSYTLTVTVTISTTSVNMDWYFFDLSPCNFSNAAITNNVAGGIQQVLNTGSVNVPINIQLGNCALVAYALEASSLEGLNAGFTPGPNYVGVTTLQLGSTAEVQQNALVTSSADIAPTNTIANNLWYGGGIVFK